MCFAPYCSVRAAGTCHAATLPTLFAALCLAHAALLPGAHAAAIYSARYRAFPVRAPCSQRTHTLSRLSSTSSSRSPPRALTAALPLSALLFEAVHWSPRGEHVVLAAMANTNNHGALEFYDVEHRKSFGTAEHAQLSGVEWDPSGRIVATTKVQPVNREPTTRETVQ